MVWPESRRSSHFEFARFVVQKLVDAGHEALFAGGCVRDQILGMEPTDYDIATSALPDEVRTLFGRRATIPVGAAFGVVLVVGSGRNDNVEVATFRKDATYSDGRHPDQVTFTDAAEDARRRDFTMNALFYDPLQHRVIDYVQGVDDIHARLVRCVGDPIQRFSEDRLRMLRAIRFATTLGFSLDAATLDAISRLAPSITSISAERIAIELRKMWTHPRRRRALELLEQSALLKVVFPELDDMAQRLSECHSAWDELLQAMDRLASPAFASTLGLMLLALLNDSPASDLAALGSAVARRWKLTRREARLSHWIAENVPVLLSAVELPWSRWQRLLITPDSPELVAAANAWVADPSMNPHLQCVQECLRLPPEQLNPPELIRGEDLQAWGVPRGPIYRQLLEAVRNAQLDGMVTSLESAREFVQAQLRQER